MNYILQIRVSHYAIDSNVMSYTILICIYQDEITSSESLYYDYHSETISQGIYS